MSNPRVLLEWQFTPDYDDATPESYRLREGRCEQPPLVEWRNPAGDWVSGVTIGWTDEAILAALVRQVRDRVVSRERIAALEKAVNMALPLLREYRNECGPCDHAVGICVCGLDSDIESIDAALGEEAP
jgi:hypothetical protein